MMKKYPILSFIIFLDFSFGIGPTSKQWFRSHTINVNVTKRSTYMYVVNDMNNIFMILIAN